MLIVSLGKFISEINRPGVFAKAKLENGEPLMKGRKVTGFTNMEAAAVGFLNVVPFLVENILKDLDGDYSKAAD